MYASEITFSTDKTQYVDGESIKISGKINQYEQGQLVVLQILNPFGSDFATIDTFMPKSDGTFSKSYKADGPKWASPGQYTIKIFFKGEESSKSIQFSIPTNEAPKEQTPKQNPPTNETLKEQTPKQKIIIDETKPTVVTSKTLVSGFPDMEKPPTYYYERYNNEADYKIWFDKTFRGLSIQEVVGYQKTHIPDFPDPDKAPQHYIDRYNNEPEYKEWFDSQFPAKSLYQVLGFPDPVPVPVWIKNNAKWWSQGQIDDANFISGIQFLIQKRIIIVSDVGTPNSTSEEPIPLWIKNNAKWWSEDLITEKDFLTGLEFLIERGIIHL